ncbi:MAG TPA: hypothetical protein VF245_08660 [Solirubrobacterales bacterium]
MRRLTILLAAVGALMLVSAAQAFAAPSFTLNALGTGSGEVTSVEETPFEPGEPPIECAYNGTSTSGVCENEPEEVTSTTEGAVYGIALLATPAPGSEIADWTIQKGVPSAPGGSQCPFPGEEEYCLLTGFAGQEEIEATAIFCPEGEPDCAENIKLNIEEGSGTVVSNPGGLECSGAAPKSCETALAAGKVTLTASPAPGYLVKSWKGCDAGGVNGRSCTVTVGSSLKTVGVKFYKVFSLEGTKIGGLGIMGTAPGGINCGYACTSSTALFKEGGLTVKAKPAKHFHFVEFTGGTGSASSCNGVTSETCTIASFNSNSSIQEVYAEDTKKTLTLTKEGGGQGFVKTKPTNINCGLTCTSAKAEFFASESPEVSVTLGKGTSKVTWVSGAGTCTGNALTCTVPMSASHSLVAKFN